MERKNEVEGISPIEQAARACVAEYNTWRFYSYLEMNLLGELLKSRQAGLPRDLSFDNKILWILVHSNKDYLEQKDENALASQHNKIIRLFLIKYNRGNNSDIFYSSKGPGAKFTDVMRTLLFPIKNFFYQKIAMERAEREAQVNAERAEREAQANAERTEREAQANAEREKIAMERAESHARSNQSHESKAYIINKIDVNAMSVVLTFLSSKESISFFQSSKTLYQSKNNPHLITILLYNVARGNQDEAEAMIKRDPQLLLASGDITDGAGRSFRCTALQYAAWAWDAHMWTMMLPYFDKINARTAAGEQLRALEEKGLGEHGSHFDFSPLLSAYRVYLGNYGSWRWEARYEHWCTVIGGAQRLLPDQVVHEYTTLERPFDPIPNFSVRSGRPARHGEYGVTWWREGEYLEATHLGGKLGRTWAAYRAGGMRPPSKEYRVSRSWGLSIPWRYFGSWEAQADQRHEYVGASGWAGAGRRTSCSRCVGLNPPWHYHERYQVEGSLYRPFYGPLARESVRTRAQTSIKYSDQRTIRYMSLHHENITRQLVPQCEGRTRAQREHEERTERSGLVGMRSVAAADAAAVTALCRQRTSDLAELLASFGITPSQAPERKSPGRR